MQYRIIEIRHRSPSGIVKRRYLSGESPRYTPTNKTEILSVEALATGNVRVRTKSKQKPQERK